MACSNKPINITFGSNRFIGTNGIISVKGKELFRMELADDLRPLITVEIRETKMTYYLVRYGNPLLSFIHTKIMSQFMNGRTTRSND